MKKKKERRKEGKKERREERRKQIKQGEKRRNKIRKSKEGSVQSTCNFFFLHKIGNWESEIFLQKKKEKKKKRRRKKKEGEIGKGRYVRRKSVLRSGIGADGRSSRK